MRVSQSNPEPTIGVIAPSKAAATGIADVVEKAGFPRPEGYAYADFPLHLDLLILRLPKGTKERMTAPLKQRLSKRNGLLLIVVDHPGEEALQSPLEFRPEGVLVEPVEPSQLYYEIISILDRSKPTEFPRNGILDEPVLREMLALAPVGIFRTTSTGQTLFFNDKMAELLHFDSAEEATAYYQDLANQLYDRPERRTDFVNELVDYGEVESFLFQARRPDGSKLWFQVSARISRWLSPSEFLIDGFVMDVTAQRMTEELLAERENRYRRVVDSSPNAIFTTDTHGFIQDLNPAAQRLFGYGNEQLREEHFTRLMETGEFVQGIDRMFQSVVGGASFSGIDLTFRKSTGERCYTLSRLYPVVSRDGGVSGVVFANTDITERRTVELQLREREEHLRRLNREKETLLREIHHRVKNNLQAIVSLIDLQKAYVEDPRDADLFARSAERVRSMALVHEQLYQSSSYADIDFADYLTSLLREIEASQSDGHSFRFELRAEPLSLELSRAIPCGLVINELVSNAMKHNRGRPETVDIDVEIRKEAGSAVVEISNTGIALPDNFDLHSQKGLGLTLVESLAAQLGGRVEASAQGRTSFTLTFPI